VLSLLDNPQLLEHENVHLESLGYKQEVIDRAKFLQKEIGSVGAYSQSTGVPAIGKSVAKYIEKRDGFPADFNNIYLSAGASSGVNTLMNVICASDKVGILVPIPQYPLYTATLSLLNARCCPYYLDEANGWGTNMEAIKSAYEEAKSNGTDVRAIVIINPGNPTGASLPRSDIETIVKFAAENQLVIMADEAYQTNVFIGEFVSFKQVLRELQRDNPGSDGNDGPYEHVELASLHSISKGMVGECGHRGGYFELVNFDKKVADQIYKFISIMLCPPVIGQCCVELMINPPKEGEPSWELYKQEYTSIGDGLKKRASALYEAFKQMEGVTVGEPQVRYYPFQFSFPIFLVSKKMQN